MVIIITIIRKTNNAAWKLSSLQYFSFFNFFIITNLIHTFLFIYTHYSILIKILYMFRAHFAHHQELNDANYTYAASGIVTLCME
jgi:hypothetical protein